MTDCSKTSTILDLPECSDIPSDSYLLVQGSTNACKVKLSNLILGAENVDFYPELIEILNKLDHITTFLQSNSSNWSSTHTVVNAESGTWNTLNDVDLQDISDVVNNNKNKWTSTASTVELLSSDWATTYTQMLTGKDSWDNTTTTVLNSKSDWDQAYDTSITVQSVAAEAIEVIQAGYDSTMLSVYTTVNANSANCVPAWQV